MRNEIPAGVLEMLTIPGLRADKVLKLYQELGLTSLEEVEEAAREGRLQKVKGLGASLQNKILRGIEMRREARGRRHMHKSDELLRSAERPLREARPDIIRITRAGDYGRGSELAGDLSLVAELPKLPGGPKAITSGGQMKRISSSQKMPKPPSGSGNPRHPLISLALCPEATPPNLPPGHPITIGIEVDKQSDHPSTENRVAALERLAREIGVGRI
jgi:hypothetical protein